MQQKFFMLERLLKYRILFQMLIQSVRGFLLIYQLVINELICFKEKIYY